MFVGVDVSLGIGQKWVLSSSFTGRTSGSLGGTTLTTTRGVWLGFLPGPRCTILMSTGRSRTITVHALPL